MLNFVAIAASLTSLLRKQCFLTAISKVLHIQFYFVMKTLLVFLFDVLEC